MTARYKIGARTCRVRVCRDCCCGTVRKHPGVDHDGLLDRLTQQAGGHAEVSVTPCLLACERSNVMVVTPSAAGRQAGGRPVWLGHVLDEPTVDAIVGWLALGGPGLRELPVRLRAHRTVAGIAVPERSPGG